uniref:Uncharacterized protein n=1 Tax=Physcomitrium patens TaxID=3218 RepID=A0A2K1L0Q7_PHYPA|nr:hypothetical protein PHYPA_002397 [Physcomitrium patens]
MLMPKCNPQLTKTHLNSVTPADRGRGKKRAKGQRDSRERTVKVLWFQSGQRDILKTNTLQLYCNGTWKVLVYNLAIILHSLFCTESIS